MEVKWNKRPNQLARQLKSDIEDIIPIVVDSLSKEIELGARRNFTRAINDISGDNPLVNVSRTYNGNEAKIVCGGEQVLFAEFGAGVENSYYEKDIEVGEHSATSKVSGITYVVKAHTRIVVFNAKGFGAYGMREKAPRPKGIDKLGHYHLSRYTVSMGQYPVWIRSTRNGRYSPTMENPKHDNPNLIWTTGTRPVRALWRAITSARNKLNSGRLKLK